MSTHKTKLELTRIGKNNELNIEPRILIESPDLSYGDPKSENILIHGDNLLALRALEQDYSGKVKCAYLDPPYNTGNAFEHYDDGLEHSQWLGLMYPRLKILKNLMSDDGVVFIQIDDYEQAYLRVIMDEVFGRDNFIACLPTVMNLKGNQDQLGFAGTHEYILCFAKDKTKLSLGNFDIDEEGMDDWEKDEIGFYKKGATLKRTGADAPREKRPNGYYPIYVTKDNVVSITRLGPDDTELYPTIDGKEMSWRRSKETVKKDSNDIIVVRSGANVSLYKKQRPELGELPSKKPKSLFYKPEYSSGNGKAQLKAIGIVGFAYPKPENLIYDLIHISSNPGDLILDSFLGSGTTAAVAQKMGRKWIGIEMGNHAYTHCKVRMDKVIDGEQGGISKLVDWKGGGGYKFYELGPSLLIKDEHENFIINPALDGNKMIQALCKIENFHYTYSEDGIKHGRSSEKDFLHVTTRHVNQAIIDEIREQYIGKDEGLLILAKTFDDGLALPTNIQIKKIPKSVMRKCEYNKDEYNLPITESDIADEDESE